MSFAAIFALSIGVLLAYVNGANDVSKGIATLVGSGVTDYRRAIAWGTAWTAIGGLFGALFARAMIATFGNGLLAPGTTSTFAAALATLFGAAGWVLLATRTGLPVSTTHAIVGSLTGVAALAYGTSAVRWSALGGKIFLPLILSPFASLLLTGLLLRATRAIQARSGSDATSADCLCAEVEPAIVSRGVSSAGAATAVPGSFRLRLTTGATEACAVERPFALRLSLDHLHWLTSGATSLARGMNDGPKMVALLLAASALSRTAVPSTTLFFTFVTVGMVGGSIAAGRRVTHVLAEKVTAMNHREGFTANLVTAVLVSLGAIYGLPMSTTHVSSGSIFGAGVQRGSLNRRTLRGIVLGWGVTLPAAAVIGMVAYAVIKTIER